MAAFADRVKETTTTTGTGTVNLGGAVVGYRTFVSGIGSGNQCWYCIASQTANEWEVGYGTVTSSSPDTLSRDSILTSSNSGAATNFSAGTKDVFVTIPASDPVAANLQLDAGTGRIVISGSDRMVMSNRRTIPLTSAGMGVQVLGSPRGFKDTSFQVPTGYFFDLIGTMTLGGLAQAQLYGTGNLTLTDDFGIRSRIVLR